jgi:hypothetical protein
MAEYRVNFIGQWRNGQRIRLRIWRLRVRVPSGSLLLNLWDSASDFRICGFSRSKSGGAGYRSLCLVNSEHALYHLSYIPIYIHADLVVTYSRGFLHSQNRSHTNFTICVASARLTQSVECQALNLFGGSGVRGFAGSGKNEVDCICLIQRCLVQFPTQVQRV